MPDTGLLFVSLVCLMSGISFVLFPHALLQLNKALNRSLVVLDQHLMSYRYVVGFLLRLTGYGIFRLAVLMTLQPRA